MIFKKNKAVIPETKEYVAIKRVFQDKRYKNREHQIMKEISHPNCIKLINSFFANDNDKVLQSKNTKINHFFKNKSQMMFILT